jgi:hypothetical protein
MLVRNSGINGAPLDTMLNSKRILYNTIGLYVRAIFSKSARKAYCYHRQWKSATRQLQIEAACHALFVSLLNKGLASAVVRTVFLQGMLENNTDITYRGCRIIYEGRLGKKKKNKAQNPIIQSHVPSLIGESCLDELVVALCRILF